MRDLMWKRLIEREKDVEKGRRGGGGQRIYEEAEIRAEGKETKRQRGAVS